MTRENKLALVVGFGLILFVGILISDHFSVVRTQQAANLTNPGVLDPLVATKLESVSLVDLIEKLPRPDPSTATQLQEVPPSPENAVAQNAIGGAVPVDPTGHVTPNSTLADAIAGTDPTSEMLNNPPEGFERVPNPETDAEFVFHEVESGETFYSICRQHFGNTSGVQALADYNNIDDPASLRIGQRLRIPKNASSSANDTQTTVKPATKSKSTPVKVTYTVRGGDTLAQIAQRFMGSKAKWKKLYDMNRSVIDDPDNVKVGTVLRVS